MDSVPHGSRPPRNDHEVGRSVRLPRGHSFDPRVAFVLHASELVNQYQPIWSLFDSGEFVVLAAGDAGENERIRAFAADMGYASLSVDDVLQDRTYFRSVVSNHPGAAGAYEIEAVGDLQIRMMYALGKDGWNFRPWNERYDVILCWGPYQAERLAAFDHPRVVQVGYPRFDRYFRLGESRRDVVARLGGDPDRPTLVWLPTWSRLSSIDAFAGPIAALRDEVNVILKVHPYTATLEPERMALLAAHGLSPLAELNLDTVELQYAADLVAADYGNSAFASIYADRDLVLLNTPGLDAGSDDVIGEDSLDRRLREWIFNIDPDEGEQVLAFLRDPLARRQQRDARATLRRGLFAPFYGCASEVAALAIRHAGEIAR